MTFPASQDRRCLGRKKPRRLRDSDERGAKRFLLNTATCLSKVSCEMLPCKAQLSSSWSSSLAAVTGVVALAGSRSSPSRTPSTSSSRSTSKQGPEQKLDFRSKGHGIISAVIGHPKRAREVAAPRAGRSEEGRASKSKQMLVSGGLFCLLVLWPVHEAHCGASHATRRLCVYRRRKKRKKSRSSSSRRTGQPGSPQFGWDGTVGRQVVCLQQQFFQQEPKAAWVLHSVAHSELRHAKEKEKRQVHKRSAMSSGYIPLVTLLGARPALNVGLLKTPVAQLLALQLGPWEPVLRR